MNNLSNFSNTIFLVLKLIFNQTKSINDLLVKTDDENLENLLKKPEDRVKFQKAIDNLLKDSVSQEVILNGKNVTIST